MVNSSVDLHIKLLTSTRAATVEIMTAFRSNTELEVGVIKKSFPTLERPKTILTRKLPQIIGFTVLPVQLRYRRYLILIHLRLNGAQLCIQLAGRLPTLATLRLSTAFLFRKLLNQLQIGREESQLRLTLKTTSEGVICKFNCTHMSLGYCLTEEELSEWSSYRPKPIKHTEFTLDVR